jgi:hypothetical protein
MIMTENDLACYVSDPYDDEMTPLDHLMIKENIISRAFLYYYLDTDTKELAIMSHIENVEYAEEGVLPFIENLAHNSSLNIVDTIHGVLKDCYTQSINFGYNFLEAPILKIHTKVGQIDYWDDDSLELEAFNGDPKYQGLMNGKTVKIIGQGAVEVTGIGIMQEWRNVTDNFNSNTISLNVDTHRDGTVKVKQLIHFPKTTFIKDPGDNKLLLNFKNRVKFFGNKKMNSRSGGIIINDNERKVNFKFGNIEFSIKETKMTDVTYVYDMIEMPYNVDLSEMFFYRLYYEGRLDV